MAGSERLRGVRRMVAYNADVFRAFENSVRRRGWAGATKDLGLGHGSLKNTLVHILNVREVWLFAIPQKHWGVFEEAGRQPDQVGSWAELRAYRERVDARVDAWVGGLSERDLTRRVRAPWMPGRYTAEDGVFQATIEQAHHLGEIIGAYWQDDRAPPPMTWIDVHRRARSRGPRRR
jgi:uncharacterized damage-inducible protein DinB